MKTLKTIVLAGFLLLSAGLYSQHGHGHRHGHKNGPKRVVVKRSAYRPARVVVYHPRWRPAYSCNRRWVYFPQHNFYWDNWRNHYVFWNGTIWVSQPAAPPVAATINLEKEKVVELSENEDDVDDIYLANTAHKSGYKTE